MSSSDSSYDRLPRVAKGYVRAALWSTNDESSPDGGEPFDANHGGEQIEPASLARMAADCEAFVAAVLADAEFAKLASPKLSESGRSLAHLLDNEQIGHDFWLTRVGHGAGFWDGDYEWVYDGAGDRLTAICQRFPPRSLYLGDDGAIHEGSA